VRRVASCYECANRACALTKMQIPMNNDSSNLPPEETNGNGTPITTSARIDMATEDRNQAHDARPRQRITS
jgi:hypothetical protein